MVENCQCREHSGLVKDIAAIYKLLDEREKQAKIHIDSYQRAVEVEKEQLVNARQVIDHRLEGMNNYEKRMRSLESSFVTKEMHAALARTVYIGMGILIAIEVIFRVWGGK